MTLTQIRRTLLVFLAVCIIAVGGLLAFVNKEEQPVELEGIADVVAVCPQVNKAGGLKQSLLDKGYQVSAVQVSYGVPKPNGYRVVFRGDTNMVQSFHATLKTLHIPCSYIDKKSGLQVGGVFKSEKEAKAKADSIRKKAGVSFEVEQSTKQVKKACIKLVASAVPKAVADSISEELTEAGCIDVKVKDLENTGAVESVD